MDIENVDSVRFSHTPIICNFQLANITITLIHLIYSIPFPPTGGTI